MISVLYVKLARDLWRQRMQCFAIVMIVACGVASQITSFSLIATLQSALDRYYSDSRFPDLFVRLEPTPLSDVDRIGKLSNIAHAQPRIVVDASLSITADPDVFATATLIGVPDAYEQRINRLVVRQGVRLGELSRNHVLVSEVFAEARGIAIHDKLYVTIQGKRTELTVAGIAISPEFLFQIREGAGVPDNRRFAVIWMNYEDLSATTSMSGMFNELVLTLSDAGSSDVVQERIVQLLGHSNVQDVSDRSEQISHRYTTNAIGQLYSVAIVPPAIFLAVAAFLVYIATSRLIKTERENIAMQRAFGYSAGSVAMHYFCFVMIIVMVGFIGGVLGGIVLAIQATETYREIYRFPSLPLSVSPWAILYSFLTSSAAGCLGGGFSMYRVAMMPPAIGLRPEPPASYRLIWYDRLASAIRLGPIYRMVLRGLGRWPLRTSLGVLGIALGIGVMILGSYTQGAIKYVIDFEFFLTRRYDVMVQFAPATSKQAIEEIQKIPHVLYCEPIEIGRFEIRAGHRNRSVTVFGISQESLLMCPVADNLRPIQLNSHGVALSQKLADALQVDLGASLELVQKDGKTKSAEIHVESLVTDYAGLNAYLDLADFQNWFRDTECIGGALLQVDSQFLDSIVRELHQRPRVQVVTIKNAALENFETNDSKNLLLFRVFNMLFSGVIGIGAVYSIASISLVERQRDLALVRVFGYSASETGSVLIGELIVMSAIAIPVGCILGYGFAALATAMLNSETQRIPLWIEPAAYLSSIVVSLVACAISACIIQRRVNMMDCVALLKSKD